MKSPKTTISKATVKKRSSSNTLNLSEEFKTEADTVDLSSEEEDDLEGTLLSNQQIDYAAFKIKLAEEEGHLWLKNVIPDGNCFFRAIADQLYGKEFMHMRLRGEVVDCLRANKEEYMLYIKNGLCIDEYIDMVS